MMYYDRYGTLSAHALRYATGQLLDWYLERL